MEDFIQPDFKGISRTFVYEYEFPTLKTSLEQLSFNDPKLRVLKVVNCPTVRDFITSDVTTLINSFRNLSVMVLHCTKLGDFQSDVQDLLKGIRKPMIVQVVTFFYTRIYFKSKFSESSFKLLDFLKESLTDDTSFDFGHICNLIRYDSNVGSNFDKKLDLLSARVNINADFKGQQLVVWSIVAGQLLSVQFLLLFNPDISELLRLGLEVAALDEWLGEQILTDTFWEERRFEDVLTLLKADARFPTRFNSYDVQLMRDFKDFIDKNKQFHDDIKDGNWEEVQSFVEKNPRIKIAYDENNQCALYSALENPVTNNFKIYSFLRSKGFAGGVDGKWEERLSGLTDRQQRKLRQSNEKYFSVNENKHIMDLLSKTYLAFNNDQKNFNEVKKVFEALDKTPALSILLKLVANAGNIKIVFDFNCESIGQMDPTALNQPYMVRGRTFENRCIMVGALHLLDDDRNGKEDVAKNKQTTLGIIAQELFHEAMSCMYGNKSKPFHSYDKENEGAFEEVLNSSSNQIENATHLPYNEIIEVVFREGIYKIEERPAELIARVAQLLAVLIGEPTGDEIIAKYRKTYKVLFDFFDQIMKEMENEIPLVKPKQSIKLLNSQFGITSRLEKVTLFEKQNEQIKEAASSDGSVFIQSNSPVISLASIYNCFYDQKSRNVESYHIFVKLGQLLDPKNSERIKQAFHSDMRPKIIVEDENFQIEGFWLNLRKILKKMDIKIDSRLIFVSKVDWSCVKFKKQQIRHSWTELALETKKKVLNETFQFLGNEIALKEIMKTDDEILNDVLLLEDILKLPQTVVEQEFTLPKFLFERIVSLPEQQSTNEVDKVVDFIFEERAVVMAGGENTGKTYYAISLANKCQMMKPSIWTVFVDLKHKMLVNFKDQDLETFTIDAKFFSDHFLESKVSPTPELFQHCFRNSQMFFIFDGFSELWPKYQSFVMKIFEVVKKSENRMLITTRPHKTLKENLEAKSIRLKPLTSECQIDFVTKLLLSKSPRTSEAEARSSARIVLERIRTFDDCDGLLADPNCLFMIGETRLATILEYESPVFNQIKVSNLYLTDKVKEVLDEILQSQPNSHITYTCVLAQLYGMAVEQIFGSNLTESLQIPQFQALERPVLEGIGLIRSTWKRTYEFAAKGFAEFLVGEFVLSNLRSRIGPVAENVIDELVGRILVHEDLGLIRRMFEYELQNQDHFKVHLDTMIRIFDEHIATESDEGFFARIIGENHTNLNEFVRKSLESSDKPPHHVLKFFKNMWKLFEGFNEKDMKNKMFSATLRHIDATGITNDELNGRSLAEVMEEPIQQLGDSLQVNQLAIPDDLAAILNDNVAPVVEVATQAIEVATHVLTFLRALNSRRN